jgi:nucleoside 2-deoxyribosyltransferase
MDKIYVAGPLFTKGERDLLETIDAVCQECGFITYLPHRDAGLYAREENSSHKIFQNDLVHLNESVIVVAVLNGADVDSGTSWELGYFYAFGKPIIGYIDDTRIFELTKQVNPMIINSVKAIVTNLEGLRAELNQMQ